MGRRIAAIAFAQLLGTALWFSGNNAINELSARWELHPAQQSWLLMAVQIGFVTGTLLIGSIGLADRVRGHHLFAVNCVLGSAANLGFALAPSLELALALRVITGLALAGIYPIGMKIVVSWEPERAGAALGWLVGALVLGTSSPFLLRAIGGDQFWQEAMLGASILSLLAAGVVLQVGEGPHTRRSGRLNIARALSVFRLPGFRRSAVAYFGHMWELYAFWAVLPRILIHLFPDQPTWWWTFAIVAMGGVGCIVGGLLTGRLGSRTVAVMMLAGSGLGCLLAPVLPQLNLVVVWIVLLSWGFCVVADSPQFSAMSARACPPDQVGGALVMQNGLGFLLTLGSIQLVTWSWPSLHLWIGWLLLPGPVLGVIVLLTGRTPKNR